MKSFLQELWTKIKHNPFVTIAFVIVVVLLLWLFGCEPKTTSPFNNNKKVTRTELKVEIEYYLSKAEVADADLANKEQLRNLLIKQGLFLAQGGTVNYYTLVSTALSILGVGSLMDNKRKDLVIKDKKIELTKLKNAN